MTGKFNLPSVSGEAVSAATVFKEILIDAQWCPRPASVSPCSRFVRTTNERKRNQVCSLLRKSKPVKFPSTIYESFPGTIEHEEIAQMLQERRIYPIRNLYIFLDTFRVNARLIHIICIY